MSKKIEINNLDAAFIIDQARGRERKIPLSVPSEKEQQQTWKQTDGISTDEQKIKNVANEIPLQKRELPCYKEVFVQRNEIKWRKCVYISHQVHAAISKLVRVLAEEGGEITVGGYIDKVLYEHLQCYKEDINEIYQHIRPNLLE